MKLLICLTDNQLSLVVSEFRRIIQSIQLSWPDATDELLPVLNSLPEGVRIELVLDLLDEDRFTETVPRVMPWEQQGMLLRLLKRRKGNDALFHSRWGRTVKTDGGRVEKEAQVVCLANPEPLDQLLALLASRGLTVANVYSLPELMNRAGKGKAKRRKGDDIAAEIQLARTAPETYRQTLVVDGDVRLSRQIQLPDTELDSLQSELAGFERFLKVQRLVPFTQDFSYRFIGWDEAELQRLRQSCGLAEDAQYREQAVAPLLDDPECYLQHSPALGLVQQLLQKRPPETHYRPQALLDAQRIRQTRMAIWALSAGLLLSVLLQGISVAVRSMHHEDMLSRMEAREMRYRAQQQQNLTRANLPAQARDIKDSTLFLEAFEKQQQSPAMLESLAGVSQVLAQFSAFEIQEIQWQRPDPVVLNKQQVRLQLGLPVPPGESLRVVSGRVTGLEQTLGALPGVAAVTRSDLPIDADEKGGLNLSLDNSIPGEESTENSQFRFEMTVEFEYEEPAA